MSFFFLLLAFMLSTTHNLFDVVLAESLSSDIISCIFVALKHVNGLTLS